MDDCSEEIEGGTFPGAVRSVAFFKNLSGDPVSKAQARLVEIHEFNDVGDVIHITYATVGS